MSSDLPRILIVSEVSLSKEGMGASRTLFNLFESYPPEQLILFAPKSFLKSHPTSPPFERQVFSFPGNYLPSINNRFGKLVNTWINAVNCQLLDWLPIANRKNLESFEPQVILICPVTPWCLLMGYKLTQHFQCQSLIYLMDDWLANANSWWLSGNVQAVAYQILKKSAGWLMISEPLGAELSNRYDLVPQNLLIVHNPVDLSGKKLPDEATVRSGTFRIAYAGSVWPMHYDALAVVAEAIFELKSDGKDIELVLYTDQGFWNFYKEKWEQWQVVYGSFIPYHELDRYLKQADMLLVATSFLPENAHMVRSSVLTKLTDYMIAGRAILACGPDYSASNQFIKKWDCGLVCETNEVEEVKDFLRKILQDRSSLNSLAKKGFEIVKDNFERSKVSLELYNFIKDISLNKNFKDSLARYSS